MIANAPTLRPRFGVTYRALLAGGPADVGRELTSWLAERNVYIVAHWEYARPRVFERPLPRDIDFVLVLIDMIGHHAQQAMVGKCAATKVPFIRCQRKHAVLAQELQRRGIVLSETKKTTLPDKPKAATPSLPPPPRQEGTPMLETELSRLTPPSPVAPPAVPPAAPPAAAQPAAASPPAAVLGRYVTPSRDINKGSWPQAHLEAVVDLAEHCTDPMTFIADVARKTGVYRTAGALTLRLRPLAFMFKAPPSLMSHLELTAKETTARKRALLDEERKALRHGVERLPPIISRKTASTLLGGVDGRLDELKALLDTQTGMLVYHRDEVLAKKARLERITGEPLSRKQMYPPKTSDEVLRENLLACVRQNPGCVCATLRKAAHADPLRVDAMLVNLVNEKVIVAVPNPNGHSNSKLYGPAGWSLPKPAPKQMPLAPPKHAVLTLTPASAPAATSSGDPVVEAVIQAMQEGRLSAEKGATVLAALRTR